MVSRKTVCLRRLGGNRRGELRAGRFFANTAVTAAKLVAGWSDRTGAACAGRHVLAIQDRCEVKFPTTAQRRRGLGPVKKGNAYGVLVHAMVAVDAASGSCLGLVGGDVWSRDGVNPTPHRQRPLAERESVHWVSTAQQAKQVLKPAARPTSTPVGRRCQKQTSTCWGGRCRTACWPVGACCSPPRQSFQWRGGARSNCGHMIPLTPSAPPWWSCGMARWRSAARGTKATSACRQPCDCGW